MIQIQVWADFECPYSYFQTIVLEKMQEKYQDRVEIVWRAFELSPVEGNISPSQSYLNNFEKAKLEPIVADEGLSLKLARALFDAFFLEGLDISNEEVVMQIASRSGMNGQLLRQALDNGELTKHVMADEQEFKIYGFQGLPAMLIGEKDFSPKSFMPINGYKTFDELSAIIRSLNI